MINGEVTGKDAARVCASKAAHCREMSDFFWLHRYWFMALVSLLCARIYDLAAWSYRKSED